MRGSIFPARRPMLHYWRQTPPFLGTVFPHRRAMSAQTEIISLLGPNAAVARKYFSSPTAYAPLLAPNASVPRDCLSTPSGYERPDGNIITLGPKIPLRGILVPALRKVFCIQRYTWCDGYTLMRQSTAPLPNFTHFLREDVLGTFILDIIFPCPQQSSHRSVTVSPEEYMSELSVGTSSQFASSM